MNGVWVRRRRKGFVHVYCTLEDNPSDCALGGPQRACSARYSLTDVTDN